MSEIKPKNEYELQEIVAEWLQENGFNALIGEDECGCEIDEDFMSCYNSPSRYCRPGFRCDKFTNAKPASDEGSADGCQIKEYAEAGHCDVMYCQTNPDYCKWLPDSKRTIIWRLIMGDSRIPYLTKVRCWAMEMLRRFWKQCGYESVELVSLMWVKEGRKSVREKLEALKIEDK